MTPQAAQNAIEVIHTINPRYDAVFRHVIETAWGRPMLNDAFVGDARRILNLWYAQLIVSLNVEFGVRLSVPQIIHYFSVTPPSHTATEHEFGKRFLNTSTTIDRFHERFAEAMDYAWSNVPLKTTNKEQ